ncbi:MAG TPA: NAD(P)/FAD-dependent oxidoreductase [Rhodothermales bacterium]|nr:NAD(P)/FAD-dependent oxidoreductase [Rhodothermales bacterium]
MYDAIVAGAGPGGSTAAAFMARSGLRVLLIDRATFPRDKVCGDAISKKAVDVLHRLGITEQVGENESLGSWGIRISNTRGDDLVLTYEDDLDTPVAPSFVSARRVFDDLVFRCAVESGAEAWQNATVEGLLREGEQVVGVKVKRGGSTQEVRASLVVGADGAYSVVARELGMTQLDEDHYCAGIRAYYEGVAGFHQHNEIEIHFVDEVLPGYFWIFPMASGRANVGIGMLSSSIKERDVRLKSLLTLCLEHPRFRDRFAEAKSLGAIKGWGLPLGSKPRPMAGDGWMLVGDAASLIDPFTGEGIGNAMLSGSLAAEWAVKAKEAGNYSTSFLSGYEHTVMGQIRDELRLSYALQRLGRWKWLLNKVVRKASRSAELQRVIVRMVDDEDERRKLVSPLFYLRLLAA